MSVNSENGPSTRVPAMASQGSSQTLEKLPGSSKTLVVEQFPEGGLSPNEFSESSSLPRKWMGQIRPPKMVQTQRETIKFRNSGGELLIMRRDISHCRLTLARSKLALGRQFLVGCWRLASPLVT